MNKLFKILGDEARGKLKRQQHPSWCAPMLATLADETFSDENWIFERKFDGERVLAFRKGQRLRLMSRNEKELNATYPEIVDALLAQDCDDFIVDGEVVAFEGKLTSFSRLQGRMQIHNAGEARASRIAVYYYLFDVMHMAGHDVTHVSLRDRKRLLKRALAFSDPLRFSAHRNEHGKRYHMEACRKGWEGLIAKDAAGEYVHGRSRKWLKFKCVARQEFVIGGFTDPQGSRTGFGALLLGYHENDELQYAGRVGTGYSDDLLERLSRRLKKLECDAAPFAGYERPDSHAHWVKPELVAEVGFTEWTTDGKLRHPRFLGLRRDKKPDEVVRES